MIQDDDNIKKALVTLAIEKALFDVGKSTYVKVVQMLSKEYDCYLPDCYDHPEYLIEILEKLYGDAGDIIVESITGQLEEFSYKDPIAKFLKAICN